MKHLINLCNITFFFLFIFGFGRSFGQNSDFNNLIKNVEYIKKTDRTYVFSRSQFIYSLGNSDYLHHWVDRPLFLNSDVDRNKSSALLMSQISFDSMKHFAIRYGLDGFAFFPQTTKRSIFFDYAKVSNLKAAGNHKERNNNFMMLPELIATDQQKSKEECIRAAIGNENTFKIGGKVVFSSYNADQIPLKKWEIILRDLKNKFGNSFIFMPSIVYFDGKPPTYWQNRFHNNKITLEDINNIKTYLRNWTLISDGLYISYVAGYIKKDRTFDSDYFKNFVIRIIKSVLAEPDLKDKFLGLSAVLGHENCTRFGYTLSCDGTNTFRQSFEDAYEAGPDFINIPEWDEQNENTSLRPTVYNGLSTLRLVRYYMSKIKNEKLSAIAGDLTTIPDLIISYRKQLTLGETLKFELLNIPDGTFSKKYSIRLCLEDENKKNIYTSELIEFDGNNLVSNDLILPSENFSKSSVIIPILKIYLDDGKEIDIKNGFNYIGLNSIVNWDYKWVKQGIRDLINVDKIDFKIVRDSLNLAKANAFVNITTPIKEPLRFVELLNNDDVEYSYSPMNNLHDSNYIYLKIEWEAFGGMANGLSLDDGSINLVNGIASWIIPKDGGPVSKPKIAGNLFSLDKQKACVWRQYILLSISRKDAAKAYLNFNIPGVASNKKVSIMNLLTNHVFGIAGPKGFNLVITDYNFQNEIPGIINKNHVSFKIPLNITTLHQVYVIQAIGMDGKIYRSTPIILNSGSAESRGIIVFSQSENGPINLNVPYYLAPDLNFNFNPKFGSAFTSIDRLHSGILGGYFAMVTGEGGGNGGDDIPFINLKNYPLSISKSAPEWVKLFNGTYALNFVGKGNFVSLPQTVIPRLAGYSLTFDIRPSDDLGRQIILAHRSILPGSLEVLTNNGVLSLIYYSENGIVNMKTNIKLQANIWTRLKISYDLLQFKIYINGGLKAKFNSKGPGKYETSTSLGGYGKDWFRGQIRNFAVTFNSDGF